VGSKIELFRTGIKARTFGYASAPNRSSHASDSRISGPNPSSLPWDRRAQLLYPATSSSVIFVDIAFNEDRCTEMHVLACVAVTTTTRSLRMPDQRRRARYAALPLASATRFFPERLLWPNTGALP